VEVGETHLLAETLDHLSRVLVRETVTTCGDEQRPVRASGDGLVHARRRAIVEGAGGLPRGSGSRM
jgi:hypothetical protein